jgi:hypothetical protein
MIPKLADEMALIVKLRALGAHPQIPAGLVTWEQRRDAVKAVLDPVSDVTFTIRNGKRISVGMEYARIYGEAP